MLTNISNVTKQTYLIFKYISIYHKHNQTDEQRSSNILKHMHQWDMTLRPIICIKTKNQKCDVQCILKNTLIYCVCFSFVFM